MCGLIPAVLLAGWWKPTYNLFMDNTYRLSPPRTPYDYQAWREAVRGNLADQPLDLLADLYGLSALPSFQDQSFCDQVEAVLAAKPEPIYARFVFAYWVGASFWDALSMWNYQNPQGADFVGDLPDWLTEKVIAWLIEGIRAYHQDRELMQNIHWLKYRDMSGDTFLTSVDIQRLEEELGYQIRFQDDPIAQAMTKEIFEQVEKLKKEHTENSDEEKPEDSLG